jgi:hypothetical protein
MQNLNNNQKNLAIYALIIVLIVGIFYIFHTKNSASINSQNLAATTSTSANTAVTGKNTNTPSKVVAAKYAASKCNFKITSPQLYSVVGMPLTVKGILDKADTSKGCMWNENVLRAGDAELFYNRNGEGWKSAGTSVPITTSNIPGVASTTLTFSASFNLYTQALGLTSGTPLKIVFTELNIPPLPNPNTFSFIVSLK